MRFSSLTLLLLLSPGTLAFGPSSVHDRFAIRNIPMRRGESHSKHSRLTPSTTHTTSLKMADENPSDKPKKKTKKEELLEEIEANVRKAEERRLALEAELAAAEEERIKLLQEAERAASIPEPREPLDLGGAAGAVPIVAGGVVATVAARSALEKRSERMEELKRKQAIAKAAAEQDAKNRAAAEARKKAAKNSVSLFNYILMLMVVRCFLYENKTHKHVQLLSV